MPSFTPLAVFVALALIVAASGCGGDSDRKFEPPPGGYKSVTPMKVSKTAGKAVPFGTVQSNRQSAKTDNGKTAKGGRSK